MKLLLDECVPEDFRHSFQVYDCHSVRFAGLKGLSNGHLLEAAESSGFDVLVTVDKNLGYQHNFTDRKIAIVVLYSEAFR